MSEPEKNKRSKVARIEFSGDRYWRLDGQLSMVFRQQCWRLYSDGRSPQHGFHILRRTWNQGPVDDIWFDWTAEDAQEDD